MAFDSAFALYIVAGTVPKMNVKNADLTESENLAMKLNGEILTPKHRFPLRLVYPGYYGYKWINHKKW